MRAVLFWLLTVPALAGGTFTSPVNPTVRVPMVPSWYTGTTAQVPRSLGSTTGTTTFHDTTYSTLTGNSVTDIQLVDRADLACPFSYPVTYNETNLSAPTNGLYSYVAPGAWSITATTTNQTRVFAGNNVVTGSVITSTWSGNQNNSVAGAQTAGIDAEMASKSFSTTGPRWSNFSINQTTPGSSTFTANPSLWTALNLTCVSAYNSTAYGTLKFQATLISPRHLLIANHVAPPNGTQFVFVGTSGTVYSRTTVANNNPADDICITLLNADLPSDVTPASVLPANWASYLSLGYASNVNPMKMRAYYFDQLDYICCTEITSVASNIATCTTPSTAQGQAFSLSIFSGDSSCPIMMKVNGTTVVLGAWHYGGGNGTSPFLSGGFPWLASYETQVNAAMTSLSAAAGLSTGETTLGHAYQLTAVSLSGFTAY